MALELHELITEIDSAAEALATQHAEYRTLARDALGRLEAYSEQLDLLAKKAGTAREKLGGLWRGAVPAGEPINAAFDPPADLPSIEHVIATDGSQIFPDRHGIAHYALVNVGAIHLRPDSGLAPVTRTFPELFYGNRLRDDEKAEALEVADISRERDQRELEKLVELSAAQNSPAVALMDSPLLLWILQPDPQKELLDWFIKQLWRARQAGVLLAGYVDRPGSRGVADLLALAPLDDNQITQANLAAFKEMPDRSFFRVRLKPGQRSALFVSDSPFNRKYLSPLDPEFEIAFFYLNVGQDDDPVIARVETPCWVARDPLRLGQLHAAVWEQCRAPGRYPYVLARAHEVAVVTQEQRRELENILAAAMLARGLRPEQSAKSVLKSLTAG